MTEEKKPAEKARLTVAAKLKGCADVESHRFRCDCALVTPAADNHCFVTVTDAMALVVLDCEGVATEEMLISPGVLPDSPKSVELVLTGEWRTSRNQFAAVIDEGRYPRTDKICDSVDDTWCQVTLDCRRLSRIAKVIGSRRSRLTLFVKSPTETVLLLGERGIGALMPIAVEQELDVSQARGVSEINERILAYQAAREKCAAKEMG